MRARGWCEILVCATAAFVLALWPLPVLANIGLPMVAIFLPPAWFALIPIIFIESAYGVWRFRTAAVPTCAAMATGNCISTLIGLPVTWVVLALGQLLLFGWLPEFAMALPLGVLTVVGAPWLGPRAEESPWIVPLATVVLTVPFYAMSVVCEYFVVRRFMPDLSRHALRSWMLGANAASYAFLLLVTLTGWMWPKNRTNCTASANSANRPPNFLFALNQRMTQWFPSTCGFDRNRIVIL